MTARTGPEPAVRLGLPADLPEANSVYRRASLSNAAGFTDDGTAETDFGPAPRMVLTLSC